MSYTIRERLEQIERSPNAEVLVVKQINAPAEYTPDVGRIYKAIIMPPQYPTSNEVALIVHNGIIIVLRGGSRPQAYKVEHKAEYKIVRWLKENV